MKPPPHIKGRALRAAWTKGYQAAHRDEPRTTNPYDYHQIVGRNITFARAFHRRWNWGYDAYPTSNT